MKRIKQFHEIGRNQLQTSVCQIDINRFLTIFSYNGRRSTQINFWMRDLFTLISIAVVRNIQINLLLRSQQAATRRLSWSCTCHFLLVSSIYSFGARGIVSVFCSTALSGPGFYNKLIIIINWNLYRAVSIKVFNCALQ